MVTTQNYRPALNESEKNAIVVRLERNQNDLLQLRCKLNSYRCEPKTYSLFETMDMLRRGLDSLSKANRDMIRGLRQHKKMMGDYIDRAEQQFMEFQRLHERVEKYFADCALH